jgi:hypothetical protein
MAIDIRAIKIMLDTNIPGKSPIPFTKSMLYNPILKSTSGFNEYPYFTMDIEFPEGYLNQLPYEKQVTFFFDKSQMERIMRKYTKPITIQPGSLDFPEIQQKLNGGAPDKEEKDKKMLQAERSEKNIMIMLKILFPTKYPVTNNILSSFSSVILKQNEFNLKFTDFLPSFLKNSLFEGLASYSYLKIDGKVFTVSQVIWLNDLYNHKEYGQLVDKFDKLGKWKDKEKEKITAEIDKKHTKFNKTYSESLNKIKDTELKSLLKIPEISRKNGNKPLTQLVYEGLITREEQTIYSTYDDLVEKLITAIQELEKAISTQEETNENNEKISSLAKKLSSYYDTLTTDSKYKTYFQPSNKTLLDKIISNLNKDIEDILILEYILEVYFNRPGLNLEFEKDEPKYRDKLKEKYKTYTDFAENIKKFRSPQRESTNPILQKTIDDFLDNTETIKGMFNFIMNPYNLARENPITVELKKSEYKGTKEKDILKKEQGMFSKRMNTGVTLMTSATETEPYFEIYVQVNLIGGELTDDNLSLVDCMYKGESMGDRLEFLLNQTLYYPWIIKSSRIFFDITEGSAKETIIAAEKEKEKENKESEGENKEKGDEKKEVSKQGGKSMTRKIRQQYMRSTRRTY